MTGDADGGWEADFASVARGIVGFKLKEGKVRKEGKCDKNG